MKLVFPGGEHAPVELVEGTLLIGSGAGSSVLLSAPGIAGRHAVVAMKDGAATVRALEPASPVVLNGRQIDGETAIKPGDLLVFARVGCSVNASERKAAEAPARPAPAAGVADGRTRVRATLPRFILRGVSGATLGKTFAVTDNAVIGRQPDCDIAIPAEEISRHHAKLRVTPEGLLVEDMGSANGTFINGQRVQNGLLKPGEELRLDTVRFLLVAPGMDARQQSAATRVEAESAPAASGGLSPVWIVVGVVALAAVAYAVLHIAGVL